jgi:hypothetical protein
VISSLSVKVRIPGWIHISIRVAGIRRRLQPGQRKMQRRSASQSHAPVSFLSITLAQSWANFLRPMRRFILFGCQLFPLFVPIPPYHEQTVNLNTEAGLSFPVRIHVHYGNRESKLHGKNQTQPHQFSIREDGKHVIRHTSCHQSLGRLKYF